MSLIVKIRVFEIDTDTQIREYTTDYSKSANREWLKKTVVWAINNHKSVEIVAQRDDDV